jgi:uncharacterized protein YbjT (DUF2867 family)
MQILLTGASGFLGAHLMPRLLAQSHQLISAGRRPNADPHISFVAADFTHDTEISTWVARLRNVDVVINAVGIFRESGQQTFSLLHTTTPCALFAACAQAGVQLVIQVSALGADEQARTPYHRSKKAADDFLATLPLRSYIVQPSLIYGADGASSRLFQMAASMPCGVQFGDATQAVQPIHIDDLCDAVVALLGEPAGATPSQRIALVGPTPLPFAAYLAALRHSMHLGRQPLLRLPAIVARLLAWLAGWLPGSPLTPDALDMLNRGNIADAAPTARLLGRMPRPVEAFISDWRAARLRAQLDWLLPLLRLALAVVWIWTALVSALVYPVAASYVLLERSGIPAMLAPLMLYGASALDLIFGIATLALKRPWRRWLWLAQGALILFYTVVIGLRLPEYLWHPYGPLSKNLPMLAALWLLYTLETSEEER